MTITCKNCDEEWERDPALKVACPSCPAGIGQKCQRPSGHPCRLHADRDRRTLEEIDGYSKCTAATAPEQPKENGSSEADRNENHSANTRQATLTP